MVLRFLFIAFLLLLGCGELQFDDPADPRNISHPRGIAYQSFKDPRDGQTYKSVVIGNQTWMAENLNYNASGSFCFDNIKRDGTIIDTLVSEGGYCDIYGRLYDWETAVSVCPDGWHLPSDAEWATLIISVGGESIAGTKLKSRSYWSGNINHPNGNGTDDYGFTAIPNDIDLPYNSRMYGIWWASNEIDKTYAYAFSIAYHGTANIVSQGYKSGVYSVRCIKDGSGLCGSQILNASTQFCDNNTVYDLCGGKKYDPATQRCGMGNAVETKCGAEWYVLGDNQRCENGVVETKCGTGWYSNTETQYCSNGTAVKYYGKLTDTRDNKAYKTVEIGTQVWMAENLNYTATSSRCYNDSETNCTIYGKLYNWSTAMSACPSGWHLPSNAEWTTLTNFVGTNAGTKLKATSGWGTGQSGGTDNYGFSALPGGYGLSDGEHTNIGQSGQWWSNTSTEYTSGRSADYRSMYHGEEDVIYLGDDKNSSRSVRCLKD